MLGIEPRFHICKTCALHDSWLGNPINFIRSSLEKNHRFHWYVKWDQNVLYGAGMVAEQVRYLLYTQMARFSFWHPSAGACRRDPLAQNQEYALSSASCDPKTKLKKPQNTSIL